MKLTYVCHVIDDAGNWDPEDSHELEIQAYSLDEAVVKAVSLDASREAENPESYVGNSVAVRVAGCNTPWTYFVVVEVDWTPVIRVKEVAVT